MSAISSDPSTEDSVGEAVSLLELVRPPGPQDDRTVRYAFPTNSSVMGWSSPSAGAAIGSRAQGPLSLRRQLRFPHSHGPA